MECDLLIRNGKIVDGSNDRQAFIGRLAIEDGKILEVFSDDNPSPDLTVFDLAELKDNTTAVNTGARPSGIRHVFLNGRHMVQDGIADRRKRNGQALRR